MFRLCCNVLFFKVSSVSLRKGKITKFNCYVERVSYHSYACMYCIMLTNPNTFVVV